MKIRFVLPVLTAAALLSSAAQAYDADWKRGRIYFRSVCTTCHEKSPVGKVNPSGKTKAEWTAYFQADKHAKGKDSITQYLGKPYRASIKATNKVAEKFADTPDQELLDDTKLYLLRSAKDGESPASCS